MTQTKHTPEEEFAVVIAALLAGKIDGQQAVASAVALSRRFGSDERQAISQRLHSMRHAWGGDAPWFTNGTHVSDLAVEAMGSIECACGCPLDAHVGEIGCTCGDAHHFLALTEDAH